MLFLLNTTMGGSEEPTDPGGGDPLANTLMYDDELVLYDAETIIYTP